MRNEQAWREELRRIAELCALSSALSALTGGSRRRARPLAQLLRSTDKEIERRAARFR